MFYSAIIILIILEIVIIATMPVWGIFLGTLSVIWLLYFCILARGVSDYHHGKDLGGE